MFNVNDLILLDRLFIENVLSSEFDDDGDVQRQANEHVQHSAHRSDEQIVVLLKHKIVNLVNKSRDYSFRFQHAFCVSERPSSCDGIHIDEHVEPQNANGVAKWKEHNEQQNVWHVFVPHLNPQN